MPEMTPLELAKKLEEWAQVSKDFDDYEGYVCSTAAASLLRKIASGEYAPVVHAHWKNSGYIDCCCSNCKDTPDHESGSAVPEYDICPYCGALMDRKDDSNEVD